MTENNTQEKIDRAVLVGLNALYGARLDTGALCVIGNDEQIKADRAMFGEIKNLYH